MNKQRKDQSGKVLCFVDFNWNTRKHLGQDLKQCKTYLEKMKIFGKNENIWKNENFWEKLKYLEENKLGKSLRKFFWRRMDAR